MSEIKVNKLSSRTGNAVTLGTSGDTFTIPAGVTLTNSGTATGFGSDTDISWQSVKTSDFTAVSGEGYFVNTTSSTITVTLPASPSAGAIVAIVDYAGTFATNKVTINRNGSNIQGQAANPSISTNHRATTLVYADATKGWIPVNDNTTENYGALYTTATGGTVTTSGDFKIHTFTSSSNFVVSQLGNTPSAPAVASYLVVAGGGGAGSGLAGGGGAGGFREGRASGESYTVSPSNAPAGITLSAQTYPITVGGGGASNGSDGGCGSSGSNSVFSTITSTGGGFGAGYGPPGGTGGNGGSGGGGGGNASNSGGSGNTPPVSPSQGNNGGTGTGSSPGRSGGGGGGAAAVGGNSPGSQKFGNGGAGQHTEINPATGAPGTSPVNPSPAGNNYYAGGGGGNGDQTSNSDNNASGRGGVGGGGNGRESGSNATAGSANTGGGGGGGGSGSNNGAAGGSGIVIIRYKYQ